MKAFAALLTAVALTIGLGSAAGNEPAKESPAKSNPSLSGKDLGVMIEGMGLSPKEGKYQDGAPHYDIKMTHDGWDFHIRLALSPNGRALWLHMNLGDLPPVDQIPAERLLNLMRKNANTTGKAQFCVRGNSLMLMQPVDNHHLTPAMILRELQDLCSAGKFNEPDYNPKNWTPAPKTDTVQK
jgi:hypothetical protein